MDRIFQHPKSEQKWTEILGDNEDWGSVYIIPFKSTLPKTPLFSVQDLP